MLRTIKKIQKKILREGWGAWLNLLDTTSTFHTVAMFIIIKASVCF